jgi:hypothetical protein
MECSSAVARRRREGIVQASDEDQACYILDRLAAAWTEMSRVKKCETKRGACCVCTLCELQMLCNWLQPSYGKAGISSALISGCGRLPREKASGSSLLPNSPESLPCLSTEVWTASFYVAVARTCGSAPARGTR